MKDELLKHLFESYKIDSGDIKKKSGSRKVLTEADLIKELGVFADDNDIEITKTERISVIGEWKTKVNELKTKPKDDIVVKFISSIFEKYDITINNKHEYFREDVMIEESDVYTILEAEMFDWNRDYQDSKISSPELKAKLVLLSNQKSFDNRKILITNLQYSNDSKIEEWLKLSYNALKILETFEVYEVMVKHWIWMVKRKMLSKTTKNQFVLNFYGKPACGKSFFVKLLTSPLADFRYNNSDLNNIQDERSIPALGNNYVHFMDELCTGTSKTITSDQELAKIKNIITADTPLKYRPMGTNNTQMIMPRTSLIAASNFHIFDVIMDSTGMRRWFEFNVGLESNKYDVSKFDTLRNTILELWTGVDENLEEGYLDYNNSIGDSVFKIQDTYVRKNSFEQWLESVTIDKSGVMRGPDAYELYNDYCRVEGLEYKQKQISSFYSLLASIGVGKFLSNGSTKIRARIENKTFSIMHKEEEEIVKPKTKNRIQHIEGME